MAVRDIVLGELPILRQQAAPAQTRDGCVKELVQDLLDTMQHYGSLGLSAPQIGVSLRVFVVDVGCGPMEFVNPSLTSRMGIQIGMESCVSFPDMVFEISRPERVTVEATDRDSRPFVLEADEILARVICHEYDHLQGVLFFDHLSEDALMTQVIQHMDLGMDLGVVLEEDVPVWDPTLLQAPSPQAQPGEVMQDVSLAVDMLADALWKLELVAEILESCGDVLGAAPSLAPLRSVTRDLAPQVDLWEAALAEFDPDWGAQPSAES